VEPSDEIMSLLRKYEMNVAISDYSATLPQIESRVERLRERLSVNKIPFTWQRNVDHWVDFGFPRRNRAETDAAETRHIFQSCRIPCNALFQSKIYYCIAQPAAEATGLFEGAPGDSFSLADFSPSKKQELISLLSGNPLSGYVTFCTRCDGYGDHNHNYVPAAEQAPRKSVL
jgi:hypothetical protein